MITLCTLISLKPQGMLWNDLTTLINWIGVLNEMASTDINLLIERYTNFYFIQLVMLFKIEGETSKNIKHLTNQLF